MAEIVRKLATIEKISAINPIPEADAIERATIRGWNVVVKKGEHQVGELVVYCEIDSLMPEREEFEFLRPRGFRIRSIKLRGQISQGIIFPSSILPEEVRQMIEKAESFEGKYNSEGFDVTEILGIIKYEAPIPAELAGQVKGAFPSHSIKTDEERIQNLIDHYEDYKKEEWIATEKVDGTSMTAFIFNGEFGISSRNLELKENETNTFWKVAREIKLEEKMRKYMQDNNLEALTLQGELLGEGIQKNKYRFKGQQVLWFRAFDPIKYQFYPFEVFWEMVSMKMNLRTVPMVDWNYKLPEKYEDLILYADGESKLLQTAREGVVFVAKNPAYNDNGRLSFKVISNKFILKHEE
jgi:RNA ligase (TIGR02306 family)